MDQRTQFRIVRCSVRGMVRVIHKTGSMDVAAGQAVLVPAGEWVQYSTPDTDGADYISVCLPAFSPGLVHRDE